MSEEKLLSVEEFNRNVMIWGYKIKRKSITILGRTHSSGTLRNELVARTIKSKDNTEAVVGVGFRFWKYGAYREFGAGRGYIVKDGIIMRGHSAWRDLSTRAKYKSQGYSEYRIRRMRTIDEHYAVIKRTPLPWLDPPIDDNIEELANLSAEFYGDEALRAVLEDFHKMMIDKSYGKK